MGCEGYLKGFGKTSDTGDLSAQSDAASVACYHWAQGRGGEIALGDRK